MNGFKYTIIILSLFIGVYGLSQQYGQANSLDNFVHQCIKNATVASTTYLANNRAVQQHNELSVIDNTLMQMDKHLKSKERLEVLAKGQLILDDDPDNLEVLLRFGIVHLQEKDNILAYQELTTVHNATTTGSLHVEAAWYLALLQSQQGHLENSQQYLQEILNTHTAYRRPAEELLMHIKRQLAV